MLETVQINPKKTHRATVIWLHGLGADGHDFANIVPELKLPDDLGIRFIFPHAPLRPVTLNAGYTMRAWFDLYGLQLNTPQDHVGMRATQQLIDKIIAKELQENIPAYKIVLAGFSQGGAMALYCGLRYEKTLAGILGLSTFLTLIDKLPHEKHTANQNTPIMLMHGMYDNVLPIQFGEMSCDELKKLGYNVEWKSYPMGHEICAKEIRDIGEWLERILTPHPASAGRCG